MNKRLFGLYGRSVALGGTNKGAEPNKGNEPGEVSNKQAEV